MLLKGYRNRKNKDYKAHEKGFSVEYECSSHKTALRNDRNAVECFYNEAVTNLIPYCKSVGVDFRGKTLAQAKLTIRITTCFV